MAAQAMVLAFGMGVDVQGEEGTKAACRAVSDAIRHPGPPLFTEVRAKGGSVRLSRDVLGFAARTRYPTFLRIARSTEDHHRRRFEQPGVTGPDEGAARLYHSAWEAREPTDLVRARQRLIEAGPPVGSSDHGGDLSPYAEDPDGLEFEVFRTVPGGRPLSTGALDLEGGLAPRDIPRPEDIDVAPAT